MAASRIPWRVVRPTRHLEGAEACLTNQKEGIRGGDPRIGERTEAGWREGVFLENVEAGVAALERRLEAVGGWASCATVESGGDLNEAEDSGTWNSLNRDK